MFPVPHFKGETVAVLGLARSGLSAARALKAGGANVLAWDDGEKGRAAGREAGLTLSDAAAWNWGEIKALVLSPGIPFTHPAPHAAVVAAQKAGVEVISDIELMCRSLATLGVLSSNGGSVNPNHSSKARTPFICITGTNGKSTTTALIGHLLSRNGYNAQIGGNIGKPVLELEAPAEGVAYVIEVSSYQLDITPSLKPNVAVLLNITPDHLDRHGGMDGYVIAKRRIFARQTGADMAVIGVDTAPSADTCTLVTARGGPQVTPVSVGKVIGRGIYVLEGILYDGMEKGAQAIADLRGIPALPGAHNWENAAAAYAAVRPFVRDMSAIARAFASFPGLPHRIEAVGTIGPVRFANDSKATNADAAAKALGAFPRDIHWIAGGVAKAGGIEPLAPWFARVARAYLIGQASEAFAATLKSYGVPYEICGTMEAALRRANAIALGSGALEPVVLLSPACASFDQFKDYEDRGDQFRAMVARLAAETGKAAA